jgi:TonB-dependent SusC/RagA subfamily outer membrane receptor
MKAKLVLVFMIALLPVTTTFAQKSGKKITLTGKVVDGTNTPVANAIVLIDGKKTSYSTDRNGEYKIKIKPGTEKIGIYTSTNGILEEKTEGRNTINFTYEGSVPIQNPGKTDPMDDVIDTGYGTVRKKSTTGSVSKIDGTKPKYASYNSIYDMIRGEVPGVVVSGRSIMIRSTSTATLNTEPMFVVDGFPVTTIENIEPSMVKSIQVLKGSAASIYGMRGSNGVIVINTLGGNDKK